MYSYILSPPCIMKNLERMMSLTLFVPNFVKLTIFYSSPKNPTLIRYIWATNGGNTVKFDFNVPGVCPSGVKLEKY